MRSQESFYLLQDARAIRVAVDTHGDRVGAVLNEQHSSPVDEGEPALDYRRNLRRLSVEIAGAEDAVVIAEDAHSSQLIRVSRARSERDEVAVRAYGQLVSTRQGLEGLFKHGSFELAFVTGEIPRRPKKLCEQLEQSVRVLRKPAVARRQLKVRGFRADLGEVADVLEAERKDLRAALDRVAAAEKKAEGTLLAKREAIQTLRRRVVGVGRTVEGLFHLAGEDELAKRIRTSARRRKRPAKKTEEDTPEARASEVQASEIQALPEVLAAPDVRVRSAAQTRVGSASRSDVDRPRTASTFEGRPSGRPLLM